MYRIIQGIIDHSWVTTNQGDQQYIYFICGALIIISTVAFIDAIKQAFASFWRA